MKLPMNRILLWAPRILGLLFALFISIFALDTLGAGYSFGETILALLIHLVPVFVLLLGLVIAWRWAWVGAVVFLGFSVWYVVLFWGQFLWSVYALMVGPPLLAGVLFLIDWVYRSQLRTTV